MYHIGMADKKGKIEKDKYKPQQLGFVSSNSLSFISMGI